MQLKANDYPSWQNAYDILRKKTDRTIEVSFGAADDDSSEVTTLRYFFPLAESLKREKIISNQNPLILRIKVSTDSSSGDKARIERFLSQVHMDQTVRIFLNGSPLSIKEQTISRIFPLCCVQYPNLLAPYGSPPYETYTVLDKCMFSPSAKQNEGDSIYAQIANNLLGYVCNPEHFVGLQENSLIIEAAEKERLSSELYTELERQLPHMTILQQIIWLYIIRELQELKQLFVFPRIKKAGKVELAWDVLEKGRLDSLSYGEGMYQLVENACLHSFGKCAWFGFRMYYTRRKPPMSDLIKDATTRQLLYNRYKSCVNPSSSEKNTSAVPNIFNRDCDFYFEFYVLDDASNQVGMVGNYNLKALFKRVPNIESAYLEALPEEMRGSYTRPKCEGELIPNLSHWEAANKKIPYSENLRSEIKTIDELFSLPTRKEPLQAHLDDITVHYGLRVLRRILAVNEGYLCVNSPGKMRTTDIYRNGNPSEVPDDLTRKVSHVTEWYGIIPISYQWTQAPAERVVDGQNCFGKTVDSPRKTLYCLRQEQIFSQIKGHKLKDIKTICNNLSPCLSRLSKENLNDSVSLFQVDAYNPYALEVFAKALFSEISKIYLRESSLTEVRIAVLLPHSAAILEFIYLFSAFYDHGEQPDMESTQIALCLRIDSYYDVITTLAGATLRDAYSNARLFAYHHSEEAAYYLPLLDYLTSNNKDSPQTSAGESTALFPFELCLPPKIPLGGQWTLNWQDNWFLQRMQHLLNTNIRSGSYGCLLDDVHIRLSSRIHITKFYEAELLFQNAGNVARFSYMLAQDLMYGKDNLAEGKRVLLLGYEKYSTSLMLQVEYWLKHSAKFEEVFTAIVYDGKDEKPVELRPFFSCDSLSVEDGKSVQPVAILPVGTTLSTVYKLHNAARRELHFADNSIVTGAHLNRARLLLQMLLTQSRVDYEDVRLFDRIFLLVNRSSFDSVNYFAKNPRESLFAYIQLAVPSYNTENDFCPACKLVAKYDLLRKRSSTERLSGEFGRLKSKHWKRTPEEYEIWLQHSIMDNPSYLGWFKQWLYVNLPDSQLRILSFVPFAAAKRLERLDPKKTYSVYNVAKNAKQQFLSETNPISKYTNLGQFIQNVEETQGKILPSFKSEMIALVKNHMIAERNYMRLYATQLSYEELDSMDSGPQDLRDGKYRDVMIDLIGGFLVLSKNDCKRELGEQLRGLKDTEAERFRLVYSTEWLISFIKVLSRPQIVNFYDYRQAITGIMSDMLRMLLDRKFYDSQVKEHGRKSGSSSKLTNWGKIITLLGKLRNYGGKESDPCLCAQFCYHVSFILIQRLADLRIHSCADTDNAISMIRLYDELRKPFSDETDVAGNRVFLEIPDPDKLIIRYLKAAKSATMTNHDDTPCLTMAESTPSMESILEKGVSGLSDAGTACLLIIVRYLLCESRVEFSKSNGKHCERNAAKDMQEQALRRAHFGSGLNIRQVAKPIEERFDGLPHRAYKCRHGVSREKRVAALLLSGRPNFHAILFF